MLSKPNGGRNFIGVATTTFHRRGEQIENNDCAPADAAIHSTRTSTMRA
jgi:hypothetical protein